nr:uncharacterized protein LOC123494969 [Aegilops tauschii subsp. strangulata]
MAQYNGKLYQPRRGPEHPLQPAEDPEAHAVINHLAVMAAEAEVEAMNAYREEHEQEVEEGEGDGQHGHGGGKVEVVQMDADAVVAAAAMAAAVVAATQLDLHRAMPHRPSPPLTAPSPHSPHSRHSPNSHRRWRIGGEQEDHRTPSPASGSSLGPRQWRSRRATRWARRCSRPLTTRASSPFIQCRTRLCCRPPPRKNRRRLRLATTSAWRSPPSNKRRNYDHYHEEDGPTHFCKVILTPKLECIPMPLDLTKHFVAVPTDSSSGTTPAASGR